MEKTADPRAAEELLDAIKLAASLPWQLNLSPPWAAVALPSGAWEIQRTPDQAWAIVLNTKLDARASSALEAMIYILTKTRAHLDAQQALIEPPLRAATDLMLSAPPSAPAPAPIPSSAIRREPSGARALTTQPASPAALDDHTQDRAWQRQMARYEALIDETDLSADERLQLRDQVCRKRGVTGLPQLLPSALQEVCDWLQKQPAGAKRAAAIRLKLATKQ